MGENKIEIYSVCNVIGALLLGAGIGLYLGKKGLAEEMWSYLLLVASIFANMINLAVFQKRYIDFLNSLRTKFSFTDKD